MLRHLFYSCAAGVLLPAVAFAYGPNKVRSKAMDWQFLSTPHFDVYYYPEEESLARRSTILAEKAYLHNSRILDYYAKAKTPLFIFQNHVEFQQTNISQGVIGPGTGGFTEAYKNRMVLPTTQSDRWLETVIFHEHTHATQFNILYGEGTRSFQVFKNYVIPLWVMEGMAEYCAQNWDAYADMVMRDAVINDRLMSLDLMDGFSHLDEVYVAYKAGQSAVQYLSDTYGADAVTKLMKKFKAQISIGQILRDITGKSFGQFDKEWRASLRQKYWIQAKGRQSASHYGRPLTFDSSEEFNGNDGAAWSPDGRKVAFVTTRSRREEIWIMDADGKKPHVLFNGPFQELGRSGGFGVPGKRLDWSPDGKALAFVEVKGGVKRMMLGNPSDGSRRELDLGLDEMEAPAFSPDGKTLAFSGSHNGQSQLHLYDFSSGKQRALDVPEGASMVTDPCWSADGKWLAFSAEEGRKNQVYLCPSAGGAWKRISKPGIDSLMPAFIDGGTKLIYVSDEKGTYNLVQTALEASPQSAGASPKAGQQAGTAPALPGEPEILSDVVTGLFCPRPSPDGSKMLFISYEDGCHNLYVMDTPGFVKEPPSRGLQALINPYASLSLSATAGSGSDLPRDLPEKFKSTLKPGAAEAAAMELPQLNTRNAYFVDSEALKLSMTAEDFVSRSYHTDISPDLFFLLLGYDNIDGIVGGGYFTASDMLGNHNLSLFANFVPGYQSVVEGNYLLYKGRFDMGLALFYRNTNYFLSQINPQQFASTFLDQDWGATFFTAYPLSSFTRLEWGLGSQRLYRELNGNFNLDSQLLSTLGESYVNSSSISVVRDTLTYKNYEVYGGQRLQFTASASAKLLGGTRNFVVYQGDYRWSWPMSFINRDTVLTGRLMGLEQSGEDRHLFYFGGAQVRGLSYNEYLGEKIGVGNLQLRQPYLKNINGTLWPFESLLIKDAQLVFFYDFGVSPLNWEDLAWTDLRSGYGGGLRLHTFMFEKVLINFSLDLAQRTDKPGTTYYYFTLGQIF